MRQIVQPSCAMRYLWAAVQSIQASVPEVSPLQQVEVMLALLLYLLGLLSRP